MTPLSPAPRARRPRPRCGRTDCNDGRPATRPHTQGDPPGAGAPPVTGSPGSARPARFDQDLELRVLAADGYELHRLVYAALAHEGERGFLFAPIEVRGRAHRVLVRPCHLARHFAVGQRFELILRAWPTVKHAGRRRSVGAARSKDPLRLRWIQARAIQSGFRLLDEPTIRVERVRVPKPGRPFTFNACLYRAPIRVTDPERFTRAYLQGIGQGRAWGCAMVVLRETAS